MHIPNLFCSQSDNKLLLLFLEEAKSKWAYFRDGYTSAKRRYNAAIASGACYRATQLAILEVHDVVRRFYEEKRSLV